MTKLAIEFSCGEGNAKTEASSTQDASTWLVVDPQSPSSDPLLLNARGSAIATPTYAVLVKESVVAKLAK